MAAVQKGTTLAIGFGSLAYAGYVASDATVTHPDGNVEVIPDADGATMTKIFMDPGDKIEADFVVSTGGIDPPADGATVTLTPPSGASTSYMSEGSSAKHSVGATKLLLSLIAEDSMTYS